MGCDIHLAVERLDDNGVWRFVPEVPAYETWHGSRTTELYGMRNYSVFGALAGVRDDDMPQIAPVRGVPKDASKEALACLSEEHTPSWVLISEVQAYLEKHKTTRRVREGFVSLAEFAVYRETGEPSSWCGGIGGLSVKIISAADAQALIDGRAKGDPKISYYTRITWIEPVLDRLGLFVGFIESCAKLGPPDRVRLVFDFDS